MILDPLLDPIRRHVSALGFELVDLKRSGPSDRPVFHLRIDRPESAPGHGVTTDDCVRVGRALERLSAADSAPGPTFQVSSPGLERPVRFPEHWRRFVGHTVRLRSGALRGHPEARFVAVPDDEHVTVRLPNATETTLALREIREATLVVDWNSLGK
jgi:ribosome maturation factor RimP